MSRWVCFCLLCAVTALIGCSKRTSPPNAKTNSGKAGDPAAQPVELTENQKRIEAVIKSEELIGSFSDQVSDLSRSFRDRSVDLATILTPEIEYRGLAEQSLSQALSEHGHGEHLSSHLSWPLEQGDFQNIASSQIWAPLLNVQLFDDCQIGTLGSRFVGSNFQMDTKFEGRFRTTDQQLVGVKAWQTIEWTEVAPSSWRIVKWDQSKFEMIAAPDSLFEDVTAKVIPDPATLKKVQTSSHANIILEHAGQPGVRSLKPAKEEFPEFSEWESGIQYPGVSVVDLDQDGFDDLFVTDRWQSAQLLRNRGDDTFEDVTESSGLIIKDLACSSFFADFDNDGDSDVFVGGTLAPSQYFENIDGKFYADEELNKEFAEMKFVVSGSAVDVNNDGLLDLYLNVYAFGTGDEYSWIDDYIREEDRLKLRLRVERSHWFIDAGGAPNILLLNHGGKLKRAKIDDTLALWRNSFQTVWTDLDQDGDQDLYICNDFAPDYFLRNDTERGSFEPKFTDISKEMVPSGTMGFGMGANWGDYNNDGLMDLYVSNMYSKAGNRIVAQFDDVDERVKVSARGNFLYENVGGTFKQVAGLDGDTQHVAMVGWSFGGQFADFDNDGNLDIYVPSGFFTPPKEVEKSGDL